MKKRFFNISNLFIGSMITLLGFTNCRCHKEVEAVYGPPPGYEQELEAARQAELERQECQRQEEERQRIEQERRKCEAERFKTVYGGPPAVNRETK
jgi:hypothetical protein